MLFRNDVETEGQAKTGAGAGRLGGEERLEYFRPDRFGNAGAVVADANFDARAEIPGGYP